MPPGRRSARTGESRQHLVAVALELRRADARDLRELPELLWTAAGDLLERRVVKDDERRHFVASRPLQAPRLERRQRRVVDRRRLDSQLRQEAARLARPRDLEVVLRARHADVEQPAFLLERLPDARPLERELALLEPREEDDFELEALGAVVGEEVHAATRRLCGEAALEIVEELGHRPIAELVRKPDEAGEIALARELLLADAVGDGARQSLCLGDVGDDRYRFAARPAQRTEHPARPRPREEGAATHLVRDSRLRERLLEGLRARVDPVQNRDLLVGHVLAAVGLDVRDDAGDLRLAVLACPKRRRLPRRPRRAQHLLRAPELRHEAVSELEPLRRRAAVLLA